MAGSAPIDEREGGDDACIEPRAGDRIFPVAGEVVRALPPLPVP